MRHLLKILINLIIIPLNYKMIFCNIEQIKKMNVEFPSIYFEPEYSAACEKSDNGTIEYCLHNDLIFVYIIKNNEEGTYIISPYGYSGIYFKNINTFNFFFIKFMECAKEKKYTNIILRQNPFLEIPKNVLKENFTIKNTKTLFSIGFNDDDNFFEDYLYKTLNSKKRNMYFKAIKNNYEFFFKKIDYNDVKENTIFRNMYNNTMKKVNATNYYYFNEEYYKHLSSMNNVIFTRVLKNDEILGCAIILLDGKYIHYHLSCNNGTSNCITFFLILEIIKNFCKNKYFNLGCGITNDDSLHKFKEKLSNEKYDYNVYEFNNYY